MAKTKIIFLPVLIAAIALFAFPADNASAATQPILVGVSPNCLLCGSCTLTDFIIVFMKIYRLLMGLIGSLTLLMFIVGGFFWITSAGNTERVERGKKVIISSVVGLFITLFAWTGVSFALFSITDNNATFLTIVSGNWATVNPAKDKATVSCGCCCKYTTDVNEDTAEIIKYEVTTLDRCAAIGGECAPPDTGHWKECK